MNTWLAWAAIVGTLVGAGGGVTALFYVRPTRRKMVEEAKKAGAEAANLITNANVQLLEVMQRRVNELEAKLAIAEHQADALHKQLLEERRVSQDVTSDLRRQLVDRDLIIGQLNHKLSSDGRQGGDT